MKKLLLITCLFISTAAFAQEQDTVPSQELQSEEAFQEDMLKEMDALLDLWYIKKQMGSINMGTLNDNSEEDCLIDSIVIKRLQNLHTVIPLIFNREIRSKIELYVCKRPRTSSIILGLSQYYFPWMREIFDKYDVPEELIYLTIIESALNPVAVSRAGATGIWQFMYATGKAYQLEVNTFVDDRRDPFKATDAAARHLRDLYNIFNDWGLAISAYNCGAGGVRKAITRSGGKTGFWNVKPFLPKETQNYFPYYIAALYLVNYHLEHGIPFAELTIPFAVDTVMVKKELHLQQVADVLDIDLEELKILNPQYKRLVIPAYSHPYPLRLKYADILRFIEWEDSIYHYKYDELFHPMKVYEGLFTGIPVTQSDYKKVYYTVKQGESLAAIANKYGLSVLEIKKMNNLSSNAIKPKQKLLVGYEYLKPLPPKPVEQVQDTANLQSTAIDLRAENQQQDSIASQRQNGNPDVYVVQKGDSLSSIAAKFGTTARIIGDYNKLQNINTLFVGQKLRIPPQ
ncbi:MAG: LysM peptidoglycan-binding domain-containing protein [Bacteroidetes bacterium]|nr:LysM peptidoglycan-binding domain-containing protein [Bacteroidota bacterium]MCL1968523.1 LysM peptidoglycan-binding domain-containing protein [Bacteroidota bacterium]